MSAALHALALAATNLGLAADVWSDWSLLDSRAYDRLHAALVARLPARAPLAIAALDAATATRRDVLAASEDFTRPMVLRGALRGLPCTAAWGDPQWWLDRYPDAELLCSSAGESRMLPVREALARPEVYVAGATTVFQHHPELKDMVETELTRAIAGSPGAARELLSAVPRAQQPGDDGPLRDGDQPVSPDRRAQALVLHPAEPDALPAREGLRERLLGDEPHHPAPRGRPRLPVVRQAAALHRDPRARRPADQPAVVVALRREPPERGARGRRAHALRGRSPDLPRRRVQVGARVHPRRHRPLRDQVRRQAGSRGV